MIEATVTICNKLGLHARAAAKLVSVAGQYRSEVTLIKDGKTAKAKSIMSVMMLAASKGSVIEISAEGPDEQAAITAIIDLINNRFDEAE
jgi:phosphocarrier protein